ncbi:Rne/Rng family ribonuclease [Peribacillus tepidiphilus]|uniref:Rne/Rng family ribonuclease n=1 Tax=Peribacillus tepidiphilus TaxID=2652445 RepID=UPI0035B54659
MKKIIINHRGREKRYAVLEDGKLIKVASNNLLQESLVGNIYAGRVEKVIKGMDAVFVDFGQGRNGFLHRDQLYAYRVLKTDQKATPIQSLVKQGEKVLVQVVADETELKGAKLTGIVELSGEHLIYMAGHSHIGVSKKIPQEAQKFWRKTAQEYLLENEGVLIRTSMQNKSIEEFVSELEQLRKTYQEILGKFRKANSGDLLFYKDTYLESIKAELISSHDTEVLVDESGMFRALKKWQEEEGLYNLSISFYGEKEDIFSALHIENELSKLLKNVVWLDEGAYFIIEENEALTTIDVNTGKFIGKTDKEKTIFDTNIRAAKEIARQIQLRNISGIILIDFINMKSTVNKEAIIQTLKQNFANDRNGLHILGFTELGFLQMTRKRQAPTLLEKKTTSCKVCSGTGRVLSAESLAFKLERELFQWRGLDFETVVVEATDDVIALFSGVNKIFKERLEKELGFLLLFERMEKEIPSYKINL